MTATVVPAGLEGWELARRVVASGGVIAFPTDTVYGIGCDPYNLQAIEGIYVAKGRPSSKALPLLLSGVESLAVVVAEVPDAARLLGDAFWPGALTLVVPRRPELPSELGGGHTIAVRVPDHNGLRGLIAMCGGAIASTSANLSGQPDALDAEQVKAYLGESIQLVVDGGRVRGGVPSTVVNCTVSPPAILRVGAIVESDIRAALAGT